MKTDIKNDPNNTTVTLSEPNAAPSTEAAPSEAAPSEAAPSEAAPSEQTIAEAAASVATSRNYKDCYTKWKPRWLLIPADEAMRVTVDVGYVIQCIYGVLPEVEKHRSTLYRECPMLSPTLIEDIRENTAGLGHCEMLKRGGAEAVNEGDNPVEVVRGIRGQLVFHGGPLVAKGILVPADLTPSQGNSPRDIAFDVMKFVAKIGDNYEHLEGKSMLTRADLDAATTAAEDLLEFLGIKEKTVATAEETTLTRQRALTQVYELYEELRAGLNFSRRRQKDADSIAPSIFTMKTKKANRDPEGDSQGSGSTPATGSTPPAQDNAASGGVDLAQLQALMSGGSAPINPSASALPNAPSGSTTPPGSTTPAGSGSVR